MRESEVLVSFARRRLSSALNVNPYLQEEYITEGIYTNPRKINLYFSGQQTSSCRTNKMSNPLENDGNSKRPKISNSSDIPLTNSFQALQGLEQMDQETSQQSEVQFNVQNASHKKGNRIPPLVITDKLENYTTNIEGIRKFITEPFKVRYSRGHLKIFTNSLQDYTKLKNALLQQKVAFYTHTLKEQKPIHLVIKGLPLIDESIIAKELEEKGIKCKKVILLKTKKETAPMYMVTFEKGTDLNEVRKIKTIYYVGIFWEKFRNRKGFTQCHNCQEFWHGSNECHRPPRCVKCNLEHKTSECQKQKGEMAYCVNCKDFGHRANSTVCPTYIRLIEHIKNKKHPRRATQPPPAMNLQNYPAMPPSAPQNNQWFQTRSTTNGIAASQSATKSTQEINDFQNLITEIKKLNSSCNIKNMLNMVKELNSRLATATTQIEQLQVFYEVINEHTK